MLANSILFIVEDRFEIAGRGLILVPGPPSDRFGAEGRTHTCQILIRRPDGSEIRTQAQFVMARMAPLEVQLRSKRGYECILRDPTASEVPVGSILYTDDGR